jgi:hypothetical protein
VKLNLKINIDEPFSWDIINQFLVAHSPLFQCYITKVYTVRTKHLPSLSLSLIAALDRLAAELLGSAATRIAWEIP